MLSFSQSLHWENALISPRSSFVQQYDVVRPLLASM
jgi:hypothetical protein